MSLAQSILAYFIMPILNLVVWIIIIEIILSWVIAFNIASPRGVVGQIAYGLRRFTDPILNPIRNVMPNLGGLDISPIIAILAIGWLNTYLIGQVIYPMLG